MGLLMESNSKSVLDNYVATQLFMVIRALLFNVLTYLVQGMLVAGDKAKPQSLRNAENELIRALFPEKEDEVLRKAKKVELEFQKIKGPIKIKKVQ